MATKTLKDKRTCPARTLIIDTHAASPRAAIKKGNGGGGATRTWRRMQPRSRKRLAELLNAQQRRYHCLYDKLVICVHATGTHCPHCAHETHSATVRPSSLSDSVDEDCDPLADPTDDTDGMERLVRNLDTLDVREEKRAPLSAD